MKKWTKRLLSVLLTALMVIGVLAAGAMTASAADNPSLQTMIDRADAMVNYTWTPSSNIAVWNGNTYVYPDGTRSTTFTKGKQVKGMPYTLFTSEVVSNSQVSLAKYKEVAGSNYSKSAYCVSVPGNRTGPVYGNCCASFVSEIYYGYPKYYSCSMIDKKESESGLVKKTGNDAKFSNIRAGDCLVNSSGGHIIWIAAVSSSSITIYEQAAGDGAAVRKVKTPATQDGYLYHENSKYTELGRPNWSITVQAPGPATLTADKTTFVEGTQVNFSVTSARATNFYYTIKKYNDAYSRWDSYGNAETPIGSAFNWKPGGGRYTIQMKASNGGGSVYSNTVTLNVIPGYPTAPAGYTDVSESFAGKTIYFKNVNSDRYMTNTAPGGNGAVWCNSVLNNYREEWYVGAIGDNGVWTGDIALQSTSSGKLLTANGTGTAAASASTTGFGTNSRLRIYRNNSTGYYYLRIKATGNYFAANMDVASRNLQAFNTQPPGDWERFRIEVKSAYSDSSAFSNGWYSIKGVGSKKYASCGNTANGTQLYIHPEKSSTALYTDQYWFFTKQSDGTYTIRNNYSGKLLDAYNGDLINGTKAIVYQSNNGNNQRWYVLNMGNGNYKLINKQTGSALDVNGNYTATGTKMQLWRDNGSTAQRFNLTRMDFVVTFNGNSSTGGSLPGAHVAVKGLALDMTSYPKPTKTGFRFDGWSEKQYLPGQGKGSYYFTGTEVKATKLYAVWAPSGASSTFTAVYDYFTNGGTSANATEVSGLNTGDSVSLAPTAVKDGWTFVGWNTDPNAKAALSSLKVGTSDVILYAIYSKTVAATFTDAVGVQVVNVTFYNNQTETGIPAAPTQRAYAGWSNAGWIAGPELDIGSTPLEVEYFVPENPEEPGEPNDPGDPADLGELLEGVGDSGTVPPAPEPPPTGFIVRLDAYSFYGLYERNITLSYNADGGSSVPADTATQQVNSFDLNAPDLAKFVVAEAPEKAGYNFLYWEFTNGEAVAPEQVVELSVSATLKAVWEKEKPLSYTVSYSAADAYNVPEEQFKLVEEPLTLSDMLPVKDGYYCTGWAKTAGGALQYAPGAVYAEDADVTLYAVWVKGADYSELSNAMFALSETANNNYTTSSWAAFQSAIDGAVAILENPFATQTQVNNALTTLNSAYAGLTQNPSVNKTNLTNRINEVKNTPNNNYTTASWNAFQSALTAAQSVANDGTATQTQVNNALATLNSAFSGLTQNQAPKKYIFSTKYEATVWNWIMFFVLFGWIWMWF